MVLAGNGNLYTFGFGGQGQLGHRNTENYKKPTQVLDFDGIRIQAISSGGLHSIVQTAKGDVYSCGFNKDGQLALGHNKSKTQFTHVSCMGGINIQRFCAGGNHSWFQIDEFLPFRNNYQSPSPLTPMQDPRKMKNSGKAQRRENSQGRSGSPHKGGTNTTILKQGAKKGSLTNDKIASGPVPARERDERNKILSNQQIVEKILSLQKMALENAQFYLQLTYCDTTFCHRFVHFEVDIDYIE